MNMNHDGSSQFQLTVPGFQQPNQTVQFQQTPQFNQQVAFSQQPLQAQGQFQQQQSLQFQPNQVMTADQQNPIQMPSTAAPSSVFQARSYFNSTERKAEIEEAATAAQKFYKLYYDTLEKKRHIISKMYMDEAVIVWNGHVVACMPQIQKFFEELPTGTYIVFSVDAQPVAQEAVGTLKTIVVTVAGIWRLPEEAPCPFQQTFIVTAQGDKWKIVSDVFRTQDVEQKHF